MSDPKVGWVKTAGYFTVVCEGKSVSIENTSPKYKKALALAQNKKNKQLIELVFPDELVKKFTHGDFTLSSTAVIESKTGEAVHPSIAKRLLEFVENSFSYRALKKFCENLKKNPNRDSADQLFNFLEACNSPITADGCFLAYKYVHLVTKDEIAQLQEQNPNIRYYVGMLVDDRTKTFDNSVGKVVAMDRNRCNSNRNETCSDGLHVAAYSYAKECGSGSVIIEVKVNPKDVVSVPSDYQNRKMRVCRFEVTRMGDEEVRKSYIGSEYIAGKKPKQIPVPDESKKEEVVVIEKQASIIPDFKIMSAREIVDYVKKETGESIRVCLKSKANIIKHAMKALGHKERKTTIVDTLELSNKSSREIVDIIYQQTGEKIKICLKSKKNVLKHAIRILNEHGLSSK